MQTKPGYKTTEFYLSAAAMLIGVLLMSGIFDCTQVIEAATLTIMNSCSPTVALVSKVLGALSSMLGGLGYTYVRGRTKTGEAAAIVAIAAAGATVSPTSPSQQG